MKKLFISVPMRDKSEEQIRKAMEKMHKIAEVVFEENLAVIPSYIEDNPPEGCVAGLWYLGESIKKMAEADYFIGVSNSYGYSGCELERDAAREYGIPTYIIPINAVYLEHKEPKPLQASVPSEC